MPSKEEKIVLYGAAGLVGQNLSLLLGQQGFANLIGIDKHKANVTTLRQLNPRMQVLEADLSQPGPWQDAGAGAKVAVLLQAQIGGEVYEEFVANNIRSTELILENCRRHGVSY